MPIFISCFTVPGVDHVSVIKTLSNEFSLSGARPQSRVTGTRSTSASGCFSSNSTKLSKRGGSLCADGFKILFSSECCKKRTDTFSL